MKPSLEDVLAKLDPQIRWFSQKFYGDWEDTAQEGRFAVCTAYPRWREDGGTSVYGFCFTRSKGAMLDHTRRGGGSVQRTKHPVIQRIRDDIRPAIDPYETDPYERVEEQLDAERELDLALQLATPGQLQLLQLLATGMTQREAAHALGVTDSAVSHLLAQARRKIGASASTELRGQLL